MRKHLNIFLLVGFSIASLGVFGQEYDDLYFTKSDRKKKKKKNVEMVNPSYGSSNELNSEVETTSQDSESMSFLGRQFQENNPSDGDVSQESLDYYAPDKTQEDYITEETQSDYITGSNQNTNFSDPQSTFNDANNQPIINKNY